MKYALRDEVVRIFQHFVLCVCVCVCKLGLWGSVKTDSQAISHFLQILFVLVSLCLRTLKRSLSFNVNVLAGSCFEEESPSRGFPPPENHPSLAGKIEQAVTSGNLPDHTVNKHMGAKQMDACTKLLDFKSNF